MGRGGGVSIRFPSANESALVLKLTRLLLQPPPRGTHRTLSRESLQEEKVGVKLQQLPGPVHSQFPQPEFG